MNTNMKPRSPHKSTIEPDMDITQSKPFDELMLDELMLDDLPITTLDSPMETSKTSSRLVSMPYDEERAIPAPISPCPSQGSAGPLPTPSVTSQFVDIESHYLIDPTVLGVGHHGSVRKCIHRQSGKQYAVKSICKTDPSVKIPGLVREISLLKEMKHKSIIQLVDVYEDAEYVHLVTELCRGGELFERIIEKASAPGAGCFSEQESARILFEILKAVQYMQSHNIVHRDLKPENILFETKDEDSPIKIIDMGLARKHYGELGEPPMTSVVGTPYYICPTVLNKSYDKSCDLWSIGVMAYILLVGYPPFNGNDNKEVYASVRKGTYCFPMEDWQHVSISAQNFIVSLLQSNSLQRMTVEQALRHPWLLKNLPRVEELRDAVEVVYDKASKKDSVLFRGLFRPRVKII
jgi:serine/threonine protein kinase